MKQTHAERQRRYRLRKKGILPPKRKAMTPLERNRKWKYGITPDEYDTLLAKQDGVCAICKSNPPTTVDHDHNTNQVRSLLCSKCNTLIGYIETNRPKLPQLLAYIDGEYPAKQVFLSC